MVSALSRLTGIDQSDHSPIQAIAAGSPRANQLSLVVLGHLSRGVHRAAADAAGRVRIFRSGKKGEIRRSKHALGHQLFLRGV